MNYTKIRNQEIAELEEIKDMEDNASYFQAMQDLGIQLHR